MKILLVLTILSAPPALAGSGHHGADHAAKEAKDPAFEISVNPDVYAPGAFREKGFATQELPKEPKNTFAPPAGETRDEAFAKVEGLEAELEGMDALDRDLLYIRARNYSPEKLREIYPKLSEEKLSALRAELRR